KGNEQGIAILFSLVMLMIFFMVSFAFLATANSAKASASARAPKDQANLIASSRLLVQAIRGLEAQNGLMTGGGNYLTAPNPAKLREFTFKNTVANKEVKFWGWGIDGNASTPTDEDSYLSLHFDDSAPAKDYIPDTTDSDWDYITWKTGALDEEGGNNDDFVWMVLHSDGLDANYIGGGDETIMPLEDRPTVSGYRKGIYTREMDIGELEPTYKQNGGNSTYIKWPTTVPWIHKKKLIASLASNYETAVQSLQVGTSPVEITYSPNNPDSPPTAKYDLSTIKSAAPVVTVANLQAGAPWFSGNDALTANVIDYIDSNNEATTDEATYCGNEKVPYLNEIQIGMMNVTVDPTVGGTVTPVAGDETPTIISFTINTELVNCFADVTSWDTVGTVNGSNAELKISATVTGTRDGASGDFTENIDITVDYDLSGDITPGYKYKSATTTVTLPESTSTESLAGEKINDFNITINSATLYGEAGTPWDFALINKKVTTDGVTDDDLAELLTSDTHYIGVEAHDPRNNFSNWELNSLSAALPATNWTNNSDESIFSFIDPTDIPGGPVGFENGRVYNPTSWDDNENSADPWDLSTSYMPSGGGIIHESELGLISRGSKGQTINLLKYNSTTPNVAGTHAAGDRSMFRYVTIDSTQSSYMQFGAVNPNTTDRNTLKLLFSDIRPFAGPYSSHYDGYIDTIIAPATIIDFIDDSGSAAGSEKRSDVAVANQADDIVDNFPLIKETATLGTGSHTNQIQYDDFHASDKIDHNPENIGSYFELADLTDAEREAYVMKTKNLMSTKYSYFTILGAVKLNNDANFSKLYAFVRRDNATGKIIVIRKSVK
ncbi:MAG: hypothetical protein NE330_16070, partial [Lentisphaeraceae bacterium]|nr:hypothetical protein [Lentisphaeraceae bacterium]